MGRLAPDEAGIHNIVRVHVATPLEFSLFCIRAHLGQDGLHRAAGARGREADVVTVDSRGTPFQAFITCVAHETQARIGLVGNVGQCTLECRRITRRHDRGAASEFDLFDIAPRRIIDARDNFGARILGTELRLVRQLLQRIVVPEFDFHTPVQGTALWRSVGCQCPDCSASITFNNRRWQPQAILDRERHPACASLRQTLLVAINPLGAAGERCIVRVTDEADNDIFLVGEIVECLADAFDEYIVDIDRLGIEMQRCDQVLYARSLRVAFDIAQLAHGLHTANLDALYLVRHEEFLEAGLLRHLVVPDFDLDAAVESPAFVGLVAGNRQCIAGPFIRNRFGW